MSPLAQKALVALFTDPQTGELVSQHQARRLGIGLAVATATIVLMLILALGAFQ